MRNPWKKWVGGLTAAVMVAVPAGYIQADVPDEGSQTGDLQEIASQAAGSGAVSSSATFLTVEQAVQLALETDTSLQQLEYNLDKIDYQLDAVDAQLDQLDELEDQQSSEESTEDIGSGEGNGSGEASETVTNDVYLTPEDLGPILEDLLQQSRLPSEESLGDQEDTLELTEEQMRVQRDELKEAIQMRIKQVFVGLLSQNEQLSLTERQQQSSHNDLTYATLKHDLGMLSLYEYEQMQRQDEQTAYGLVQARLQLNDATQQFLTTLELPVSQNTQLVPVSVPAVFPYSQPSDNVLERLVDETYAMKQAALAVEIAEDALENAEDAEYNGNDELEEATIEQAELDLDIAREQEEALRKELLKQARGLYTQANDAYQAYQTARSQTASAGADQDVLNLQYELGLVSKQQYEKTDIPELQAALALNTAQYQYYLSLEQIDAFQKGYLQASEQG